MEPVDRPGHLSYTDWVLTETQFEPDRLHPRETVFTIGNGYLGTRGSFEEGYPQALAATLINGVYDDTPVVYTELANCPDWLPLVVIVAGDRFRLDQGEVIHYQRQLNLQHGILSRSVRWQSPSGHLVDLHFERFASLADPHVLGVRCQITLVNGDAPIEVQASLNGYPENQGFNHWALLDQGKTNDGIWLHLRTRNSRIELGMAAGVTLTGAVAAPQVTSAPGYPTLTTTFLAIAGQPVTVEKIITVYTSKDTANPAQAAPQKLAELPDYETLRDAHQQAWETIWHTSDIVVEGDTTAQLAIRYNLFQLLIAAPPQDQAVSIPAKTLSGFGYRGHIFWDTEIFILPFFTFTQPAIARNLLTYRYHTLPGARRKAAHGGYTGAMFAWESADTGDEVTPRWSMPHDPYAEDVRIWCRDREIHISADIAYAVWHYWQATGDDAWMRDYGAEIILDTALFWGKRVELNAKNERYEIHHVIGADEYHELVNNNAFTNCMVQWHLTKALCVHDWLHQTFPDKIAELEQKLQFTPKQQSRWQDIITNLWLPYDATTHLIEQCDGFFRLKDLNLADYEPRTRSIQAVLGIEATNQQQVLKQPDVLMLLYLLRQSQDFPYSPATVQANWDYYAPRTDITYGSSLGPAIHAILAADLGYSAEAYTRFMQAALVDLEDVRGNAWEGIHGASAGGVWQAVVWGFGGIQLTTAGPVAQTHLPPGWKRLHFKLYWRGHWHAFDLRPPIDIQAVIFDLDGVLTDTAEFHYQAWQRLADEEGLPFDRQANEALRGIARRESLLQIVGDRPFSETQLQAMMARKNQYYTDLIQTITPDHLLPGVQTLLIELKQAGIKVAIGSASKNARTVLQQLGINAYIDAIADGYSVQNPKPAPDLFLHAADLLGIAPAHCVVIEDAAAGTAAAIAAGMWAVGLGTPERFGPAHLVLPDLANVHFDTLQVQLNKTVTPGDRI